VEENEMKRLVIYPAVMLLFVPCLKTFGADSNAAPLAGLSHVGIAISDLQPALHFYVDQLGMKEAYRLTRPDGSVNLVDLRVGDSNTFVELFPGRKNSSSEVSTTNHLGLFVKDLQATLQGLKDRGYPLPADAFEKARKVQADNCFIYFIQDPDGNKVELSQLRPDSLQLTSRNKK
jgi:lactoylglutathione lyase